MKIWGVIKYPLLLLLYGLLVLCCGVTKEIAVESTEKIVVRDSIVFLRDSILVEIPVEKIVQVLPADTTSQITTSLAFSEAKIDKGKLYHSLEQKGKIKAKIDTFYVTQYVEKIKEVEVPIEVIKEVKHIPTFFWISLIINIVIGLLIVFRLYLKTKGL